MEMRIKKGNGLLTALLVVAAIVVIYIARFSHHEPAWRFWVIVAVGMVLLIAFLYFLIKGGSKMKKGNIFLLVAASGIFLFVYDYYFQGLLTTVQAIFCYALFSSLAAGVIWIFSLLAKEIAGALTKEHATPPYLEEVPKKRWRTKFRGDVPLWHQVGRRSKA